MSESRIDTIIMRLEERGVPALWPPYEPDEEIAAEIRTASPEGILGRTVAAPEYGSAAVAGLLLWADCLDESHSISQQIDNETGSYWHGIVHRREPDYSNSRYWFRRVGRHPVFEEVRTRALTGLEADGSAASLSLRRRIENWGEWDPEKLITLIERAREGCPDEDLRAVEAVQLAEIRALLDWTIHRAVEG